MPERTEASTVDAVLDGFIAAWHAGAAPSATDACLQVDASHRDELAQLIGAFLELAPTMPTAAERTAELIEDPLVQRITGLEGPADAFAS